MYASYHCYRGIGGFPAKSPDCKTMLRAHTGIVVLDDGVIADKRNCRDID